MKYNYLNLSYLGHAQLLDNRRYFLAIYKINCQCLGSRMAYSSVDYSGV